MKTHWLSKIIRNPALTAFALVLATVTASSAVTPRKTYTPVKRGLIHFEVGVPRETQTHQDDGWYKPTRSPNFDPYLH
jgi:hypothetical protein